MQKTARHTHLSTVPQGQVDAVDAHGWTPLHCAAGQGLAGPCRLETSSFSSVISQYREGSVENSWTQYRDNDRRQYNAETCKLLLDRGGAIDAVTKDGWTPLHLAAGGHFISHFDACSILLTRGCATHPKAKDGSTALHLSATRGEPEVCGLLVDHGCAMEARDNRGWTPLHCAAGTTQQSDRHTETCKLLLDRGCAVDVESDEGETPLALASSNAATATYNVILKASVRPTKRACQQLPL